MKDKRINLAIVQVYCGPSGEIGFYNSQEVGLAKALVKFNYNVFIIHPKKSNKSLEVEVLCENITILKIPCYRVGTHAFYRLNCLIDYNIKIVHLLSDCHAYAPHVMNYCRRNNIYCYNYVGTIYSDSRNILKRFVMNFISKRNIKYFKRYTTFAKTPWVQKQLQTSGIPCVKVIPVGLDFTIIPKIVDSKQELRRQLGLPLDKKIVIFVGRLEEYKQPLEAIRLLNKLTNEYFMIIIGNGSLRNYVLQSAEEFCITDRLKYIESIPNKHIHKYYKASDFFVNFNDKEIFGMSILEAMYHGCVVIAKYAPGPNFIIEDKVSGYLADSLQQFLIAIKKDTTLISDNSNKRITQSFTWERSAELLYDETVNKV